jgi:hypothetical protein
MESHPNLLARMGAGLRGERANGLAEGGRSYHCAVCAHSVFFRNSRCLTCGSELGYDCRLGRIVTLVGATAALYRRCANFRTAAACNWLVEAGDTAPRCVACRLNRTIPDLSRDDNALLWQRIEVAKRRLVSQLVLLGLPVATRLGEDPQRGLAFDLLRASPGGPPIVTGHAGGIITLDIEEADDARREAVRAAMGEPYRTLLGHFRHEIGHYYWQRLVQGTRWLEPFRALFGDERADYAAALYANAEQGPRVVWSAQHVSAYASIHPWEDWAETWAHYLHMLDVVHTALGFGLDAAGVTMQGRPFGRESLWRADVSDADDFLGFVNAWVRLTCVLNEMSQSMGQPEFYPFVLPHAAVAKLQFIPCVVRDAGNV